MLIPKETIELKDLVRFRAADLKQTLAFENIPFAAKSRKAELAETLRRARLLDTVLPDPDPDPDPDPEPVTRQVTGRLALNDDGSGYVETFEDAPFDRCYLAPSQIECFRFRERDIVSGEAVSAEPHARIRKIGFSESAEKTEITPPEDFVQEISAAGVLEILKTGGGFLRANGAGFSKKDVFISKEILAEMDLRAGDRIEAAALPSNNKKEAARAVRILSVNGHAPCVEKRRRFKDLRAVYPDRRIPLGRKGAYASQILDLLAPAGFGQRLMLASPAQAGKTTLLKELAEGVRASGENTKLIMLLVDERPEEVSDIEDSVDAEIFASPFTKSAEEHIRCAHLALERGRRLAEEGFDAVIIMDSLTRLIRANNRVCRISGRTMSGGLDVSAFDFPKKLFGSAGSFRDGGSLTIFASILTDTGSRMDDAIYEEMKSTGNAEIRLSRRLADLCLYPAVDLEKTHTRNCRLLMTDAEYQTALSLRRKLSGMNEETALRTVLGALKKYGADGIRTRFAKS